MGPASQYAMSQHCQKYLSDNGYSQPELSVPFSGGQCVGAPYTAGWTYLDGSPFIFSASVIGPITAMTATYSRPGPFSNVEYWYYRISHAGGVSEGESAVQPKDDAPGQIVVFRTDGQPDNCGDPAPTVGPGPNPAPRTPFEPEEEPFDEPDTGPILPMPEIPNPFGDPISLPNLPIPRPGGEEYVEPPSSKPSTPEPGTPGTPEETGGDGTSEGGDPDQELVGVLVEALTIPESAREATNFPSTVYIGPCYVWLGLEDRLDLQPEAEYVRFPQFFYAPVPSTHWRVTARVGYNLRVTPYYREKVE